MKPLPYNAEDVLLKKADFQMMQVDSKYGNTDLIDLMEAVGIAGPLTRTNPWEAVDPQGNSKILAAGYSALPLGEYYPPLTEFISRFLQKNDTLSLGLITVSKWRAALQANLISLLSQFAPDHKDSKVFFGNSGTEAIECSIKFARAYRKKAKYWINFTNSYHGKTIGSLSITPYKPIQEPFLSMLMHYVITLPFGDGEALLKKVEELGADNIISIILETVQGEAGVVIPPSEFLDAVRKVTDTTSILLIVDEIQIGLGRSGYWFPSIEWAKLSPDIIALSKPLAGGIAPISATIARKDVYMNMFSGLRCTTHSNTFGGNALSMAVGLKSLEIHLKENLIEKSRKMGKIGLERLQKIAKEYPELIKTVRGFGMLFAIEFRSTIKTGNEEIDSFIGDFTSLLAIAALNEFGVLANLAANKKTFRLSPALNMPDEIFNKIFDNIESMAKKYQNSKNLLAASFCPKILECIKKTNPGLSKEINDLHEAIKSYIK